MGSQRSSWGKQYVSVVSDDDFIEIDLPLSPGGRDVSHRDASRAAASTSAVAAATAGTSSSKGPHHGRLAPRRPSRGYSSGGGAAQITLDAALSQYVGQLGAGQAVVLVAASLSWVSLACVALAMVFFSTDPIRSQSWRCSSTDAPSDAACAAAFAAAPADPAPFCALARQQYVFTAPRLSAVAEMELVCGKGWRAALGNSAYFAGIWIGSTPFG
jgi:hypothetical protein